MQQDILENVERNVKIFVKKNMGMSFVKLYENKICKKMHDIFSEKCIFPT